MVDGYLNRKDWSETVVLSGSNAEFIALNSDHSVAEIADIISRNEDKGAVVFSRINKKTHELHCVAVPEYLAFEGPVRDYMQMDIAWDVL